MKKITLMLSISSLLFAGVSLSAEQDTFEKMMQFQTHVVCSSGGGTPPDPLKGLFKPPLKISFECDSFKRKDVDLLMSMTTPRIFSADSLTEQRNAEKRFEARMNARMQDIFKPLPSFKIDDHFTPLSLGVFDDQKFKLDLSSFLVPLESTKVEIKSLTLSSVETSTSTTPHATPVEEQQKSVKKLIDFFEKKHP